MTTTMKLSAERESEIIEAYKAWDGTESVDSFARRQEISKQTLYSLLRRRNVPTKTEQKLMADGAAAVPDDERGELADFLIDRIAEQALKTILEENKELHVLQDRVERLERALRDAGVDPTRL